MKVVRNEIPIKTGNFKEYLQKQKFAHSTIREHIKNIERFKQWCETKTINCNQATYKDLLNYINYQYSRNNSKQTINIRLTSIKKYYNYLLDIKQRKDNPASELRVKDVRRTVIQDILTPKQLDEIYQEYINRPVWSFTTKRGKKAHKRNQIVLGLMIYQGLYTGELKKLEVKHIDLTKGKIYIPSTRRSNSRILKLQAIQIIPLQQYLKTINATKLFTENIHGIISGLMKDLCKTYPHIKSTRQLRSSVIIHWLKQYNIRQVQYMVGHRYIKSTERYKQEDLSDLQSQLEKYHPLK